MKILFLYPNISMSSMVPLGIASMSAYLKSRGMETDVFDTTFYDTGKNANVNKMNIGQVEKFDFGERGIRKKEGDIINDFREKVINSKPNLIAVSMVEDAFFLGITLLKSIQDLHIPNIVGGVFPTFAPYKVLSQDVVDMICIGEGEESLYKLCKSIQNGGLNSRIPSIWHKNKGDVVKTTLENLIKLDDLPTPDYDLFPEELLYRPMQGKVRKTVGIETQRGCPFTCAFCNSPSQKKLYQEINSHFYRRKSVSAIKRDLKALIDKHCPEFIYWIADTFMAMQESEWLEFHKMYMEYRLPFWMNTRPETITKERIRQLEEMNCLRCNIGIEHGNYDFRKNVIKRRLTDDKIIEAFKAFEGSSITIVANTIIGYPGETEELIRSSIEFNRQIAKYIDSITVNIFTPYHGTPLRERAIELGYLSDDVIVKEETTARSLLNMPHLSNETLKGLLRTFPLYVKLPKSYYPDIARCEKLDEEGDNLYKELLELYRKEVLGKKKGNEWEDLH
ncbi:Fe-S oxidoreductase [Candidatus Magnetoovum chiemensis]|nr:Fe-S oxidoreductase [Candidatus Magnetoovum chiemensis]